MVVMTKQGVVERSNPAWGHMLGWSEADLARKPVFEFIHPDDLNLAYNSLEYVLGGETLLRYENRFLTKDGGYRFMSWVCASEGDKLYATGRDITEAKERQAQLAQAQEALRQSQKMEAVGQLTGGIAHDFNNLLVGVTGSLELLEEALDQGRVDEARPYIAAAQASARRAATLTQRLLAFSRRQTLDPKPTDVAALIAGLEDLMRRTVGPGVELLVVGEDDLWRTQIDPSQLENALLNLAINARDAMPDGGRITIKSTNLSLDEAAARTRQLPPGDYVSVCVSDTGVGMSRAVIERAFDPFFTTKPLGQGTGLGLSMIHGFVIQSGGQVRIDSAPGLGAAICLELPRCIDEAAQDLPAPRPAPAAVSASGASILVIDDEAVVRMLMRDVLKAAGYRVMDASDGLDALKILQSDAPIDLLITDVGLPGGMNGRQVAEAARVARPGLKALFVTGYAENDCVGAGKLEPGMQVLTKPFAMNQLKAKVSEMTRDDDRRAHNGHARLTVNNPA
jgi:PAS domain S-box-containing protein